MITRGHEILDRELAKAGLKSALSFDQVAQILNAGTTDELLTRIGFDDISVEKLRAAISAGPRPSREDRAREAERELVATDETKTLIEKKPEAPTVEKGFLIASTSGLYSRLAQCCCPVPNERIVGYVTRGHGVTIHHADCPNVNSVNESARMIPAGWGEYERQQPLSRSNSSGGAESQGANGRYRAGGSPRECRHCRSDGEKENPLVVFELLLEVSGSEQLEHILESSARRAGFAASIARWVDTEGQTAQPSSWPQTCSSVVPGTWLVCLERRPIQSGDSQSKGPTVRTIDVGGCHRHDIAADGGNGASQHGELARLVIDLDGDPDRLAAAPLRMVTNWRKMSQDVMMPTSAPCSTTSRRSTWRLTISRAASSNGTSGLTTENSGSITWSTRRWIPK